jgi:hypothetical protein
VHAALLSTPWRLCLTATVYHRAGDPGELLTRRGADGLDDHLLARYVTAAALAAADANPHGYTPRQIHHWLHHLAAHLTSASRQVPGRTDIALERLWPMAGAVRVRSTDALLTALALLLPLPLAWTTSTPKRFALASAILAFMLGSDHGTDEARTAVRLDLRLLATSVGRSGVLFGSVFGVLSGLASGSRVGLVGGVADGLAVGAVLGLVGLEREPGSAAMPGTVIGADARLGMVFGFASGVAFGLPAGLGVGRDTGLWTVVSAVSALLLTARLREGSEVALAFLVLAGLRGAPMAGLAVGLVFGVGVALTRGSAAWRYLVFLLCARGRVPFRLARFLDWGCEAGLIRYSGPAYQFRHRELQLWLAAHPDPVA